MYSSQNIIRAIKQRRKGCAGHAARVGNNRQGKHLYTGNLKVKDHLGDLDLDGRAIIKWILKIEFCAE